VTASYAGWFSRQASTNPQATALITVGGEYRYAALGTRVARASARYVAAGLVPGQPLAVVSRSAHSIALCAQIASYLGCAVLPLHPARSEVGTLIGQCGIRQAITESEAATLAGVQEFPSQWVHEPQSMAAAPPACFSSHDAHQLMIATSGTTGAQRVVVLNASNLLTSVEASRQCLGLRAGDMWLDCLPLTHIGGFAILLRCSYTGASVLLHEGFDAEHVAHELQHRPVTHISLVPAMLAQLLDCGIDMKNSPALRCVLVGGGPLDQNLAREAVAAGWPLCVSYGMSETASHVTLNCDLDPDWRAGNVGQAVPGVRVSIVADASSAEASTTGRVRVTGPVVMAGYITDDGLVPCFGSLITQDLGFLDDKGNLHVTGRADDMLVSGGRNIHPAEVEQRIAQCPGVREVAVTARPDPVWGDRLVACIAADVPLEDVERWCRASLPGYLRPREFLAVDSLPRNALGKLQRHRLPSI
jgi:O-succinylbenzoic acid--CoA ligase